jgi:hypothetical protein
MFLDGVAVDAPGRDGVLDCMEGLYGCTGVILREPRLPKDLPPDMPLPARARASEGRVQAKNMTKHKMLNSLSSKILLCSI